jgi:hypothetical protein
MMTMENDEIRHKKRGKEMEDVSKTQKMEL